MSVSLYDLLVDLSRDRHVATFVYSAVIMLTGYFVLSFLGQQDFVFWRSILFMGAWFILIILLQPPEEVEFQAHPFEGMDLFDEQEERLWY